MSIFAEDPLLKQCLSLIEQQLGWGETDRWSNQDFESLREKIFEVTGYNLSIATLKRVWGRVKYDSKPTITTLNALAKFIGFESWREFIQKHQGIEAAQIPKTDLPQPSFETTLPSVKKSKNFPVKFLAGLALIFLLGSFFLWHRNAGRLNPDPAHFAFSSRTIVSEGLPNSVVFDYDAGSAPPGTPVFIQQSWDQKLTQQVSGSSHQHTSIYYYPGFFRAKLVVGGKIMKEHDLWIKTKGWLPVVEQPNVPVYFSENVARKNGILHLPESAMVASHIPMQPVTPWVSYFLVKKWDSLLTDNFYFETLIKSDYKDGAGACQLAEISLLCENGAIAIPLSAKGCVSNLNLYLIDSSINGKTNDLSLLGSNMSDWVKLVCRSSNQRISIYVNDVLAYQGEPKAPASQIAGLRYRFQGTGSIASVKLARLNGDLVYATDFK
jgi:hypothetical protein